MMEGANGSNQVLTFTLGMETYGVDILRVKEIRGWAQVTRTPQSPPDVLGVLSLRGAIVPIVDLRMGFRLEPADLKPAPDHGRQASTAFIRGLMTVGEHMVMLLDIARLVGGDIGDVAILPTVANG
jgi:purine-binding chemotaxis protein CheW